LLNTLRIYLTWTISVRRERSKTPLRPQTDQKKFHMPHFSAPHIASINTSITSSMTTTRTSSTHTLKDLVSTSFAMSRKLHSPVWIQRTLLVRQDATNLLLTSTQVFQFHNSKTMNLDSTTKKLILTKLLNSMRKLTLSTSR